MKKYYLFGKHIATNHGKGEWWIYIGKWFFILICDGHLWINGKEII
jgi:hypothetical protein